MKYQQCKGNRLKSRFFGIFIENSNARWWNGKHWIYLNPDTSGLDLLNYCPCKSFKAFLRHLRKYGEKDILYLLRSEFIGYDIKAFGRRKPNE